MHRAHLRCGLYNNVFFVVCLPYCVGTDPLSASPLSLPRFPSPFEKKRSIGPRFFIFPSPHFGGYCLFGNPKSPGIELIYRDGYLWKAIICSAMSSTFITRLSLSSPFSPIFRFLSFSLSLSLFVLHFPQFFIENISFD